VSAPDALRHVDALTGALDDLRDHVELFERWADVICGALLSGGRLLAVGNGGSAAHAQHLTSELVGRFETERRPLSAIALHAETSSVTAIGNDYGIDAVFARQVAAHGRPGDVLVAFSTSGASANVLAAVRCARSIGLSTFALTGRVPNPLAAASDSAFGVGATRTATVQEVHQVAVHLLCAAIDARCLAPGRETRHVASPADVLRG
jgi:D-sedoheptulose 7-phosphate isomerase